MDLKKIVRILKKTRVPVSADRLKFGYGERDVLHSITLNVKDAKITSIIGKSGSGKSTFLKLASGIISGRSYGDIRIFGRSRFLEKSSIGFVSQELAFIPDLTIRDNIRICGLNLGITERQALLKAHELMANLRLDEDLTKKPTQISGGQKVRLNIVLSLLHDPKIVILDEPFVGLDFMNRRLLWHFIESLKQRKKSVILTSHLLSEAQEHADRLVILKNGRIFFNGKLESLKKKMKMSYIFEARFHYLSSDNFEAIKKFCAYKDIKILDKYQRYIMFALQSERTRDKLLNLFSKLKMSYEEVGYREPNLDEIFLNA